MSFFQKLFNASFISQCAKQLKTVSPSSSVFAERFCREHSDTLLEIKSEGWHVEGSVNLLCIYMLDSPALYLGDSNSLGKLALRIASKYAIDYIALYPTSSASRPLTESLECFNNSTFKTT